MSVQRDWDYPCPHWHGLDPVMTVDLPTKFPWDGGMMEKRVVVPDEIKDLLMPDFVNALEVVTGVSPTRTEKKYQDAIIEAFRRGQRSKEAR